MWADMLLWKLSGRSLTEFILVDSCDIRNLTAGKALFSLAKCSFFVLFHDRNLGSHVL